MKIFITGASSGLGRGLALHYAGPAAVIGVCARRGQLLRELAAEIEGRGARAHVYAVDVADTGAMRTTIASFVEKAGTVDLVIANAGIGIPSGILAGESEPIERLLRINLIGVTNTLVPFVPTMVAQRRGVLAAVASVAGHRGMPFRAAYGASKAGVIEFVSALRMEPFGTGVHAMALCPGFVRTPMTAMLTKCRSSSIRTRPSRSWSAPLRGASGRTHFRGSSAGYARCSATPPSGSSGAWLRLRGPASPERHDRLPGLNEWSPCRDSSSTGARVRVSQRAA